MSADACGGLGSTFVHTFYLTAEVRGHTSHLYLLRCSLQEFLLSRMAHAAAIGRMFQQTACALHCASADKSTVCRLWPRVRDKAGDGDRPVAWQAEIACTWIQHFVKQLSYDMHFD